MDPLMVAGHVGELVILLRHFDRLAPGAEFLADLRAKFSQHRQNGWFPWPFSGGNIAIVLLSAHPLAYVW
jgi:hypothetical protein